jgi:hypothetical protein
MDEVAICTPADDVVFLESLDKHDGLVARHRFDHLPVTLGAAYNSDHIVDAEPSKDRRALAASITRAADGSLMVTAASGAPDFWAPGGMTRSWRIDPDQSFLLGGQRFRVRTRGYVASPRALANRATSANVLPALGRWAVLWALPLALICGAIITWLGDIDGERGTAYISGALITVGMLAVWSGVWAALSRLTGRASHFLAHLSLAALAVVAVIVLDYLFDTAAFAFNLPAIQRYDYALVGLIIGVLVWCHTRLVTRLQARTAVVSAFAVGGALFAFQALTAYTARGNISSTATLTELRPPALRVATAVSTDAFFADSESLKAKADATRSEKPDGSDFSSAGDD